MDQTSTCFLSQSPFLPGAKLNSLKTIVSPRFAKVLNCSLSLYLFILTHYATLILQICKLSIKFSKVSIFTKEISRDLLYKSFKRLSSDLLDQNNFYERSDVHSSLSLHRENIDLPIFEILNLKFLEIWDVGNPRYSYGWLCQCQ